MKRKHIINIQLQISAPPSKIQLIGLIMACSGMRPADWAKSKGIPFPSFYRVANGTHLTSRVLSAVAELLNAKVSDLWPENKKAPSSERNNNAPGGSGLSVSEDGHSFQGNTQG